MNIDQYQRTIYIYHTSIDIMLQKIYIPEILVIIWELQLFKPKLSNSVDNKMNNLSVQVM